MTNEQINIAIAEACPGKFRREDRPKQWAYWSDGAWRTCRDGSICADLNAMHSALTAQGQGLNDKFSINLDSRAKRLGKHVHQLIARDWAEEFILQFKRG